jgi:uncharacterized protein
MRWLAAAGIAFICAMNGGCSLTAPRPDLTKYYVLTAISEPNAVSPSNSAPAVGLGPIMMPGYLDHSEIITRIGANELNLSGIDRWAEPVQDNFKNVLARDLSQETGGQVIEFPWYNTLTLDYKVEIVVSRFDSDQSGDAVLDAKWTIRPGHDGQILFTHLSELRERADGPSTDAKVGALSADVGDLGREIGQAIEQLHGRAAQAHADN